MPENSSYQFSPRELRRPGAQRSQVANNLLNRLANRDAPLREIEAEFKRISEEGIFSPEDMQKLRQRMMQLSNFRRRQASRGLRQNLRLGPRSGAAEGFIANRYAGPELAAEAGREADLFGRNVESRFQGLQGRFNVEQYREQLRQLRKQQDSSGGLFGVLKSIAPIALSFIPGVGPVAAAGQAVGGNPYTGPVYQQTPSNQFRGSY